MAILVIRIGGMVDIDEDVEQALYRLRLRRKYCAVLLDNTEGNRKLLRTIRDYVAYGDINREVLEKLIMMRGKTINKNVKIDQKKIVDDVEKKGLLKSEMKPFFRLHPPRGGIESKKHAGVGKGVLGDNKEKINDLVLRML